MRDFCVLSALTGFGGRPVFPARFYSRLVADYIIIISLFFFFIITIQGTRSRGKLFVPDSIPHDSCFRGQVPDRRHQNAHFRQSKLDSTTFTLLCISLSLSDIIKFDVRMCLFRLASFYDFILVWFVYFFLTKKQTNESFMILFVIKYNKITWEGERM
jgi:hypothetical protein